MGTVVRIVTKHLLNYYFEIFITWSITNHLSSLPA